MAGHAERYEIVIATITFQVINMVNVQFARTRFFAAELALSIVAIPYILFEILGKLLVILSGYSGIVHRPLFSASSRAELFVSMRRGFVRLATARTYSNDIVPRSKSVALTRTIAALSALFKPYLTSTVGAPDILLSRMSSTFVRAKALILRGSAAEFLTAMFANKHDTLLSIRVVTLARAESSVTPGKIVAVGFKSFAALFTGIVNRRLLARGGNTRTRTEPLRFVLGAKLLSTLWTNFLRHSISCYANPELVSGAADQEIRRCQRVMNPLKPYSIIPEI
jgi:hypothetical protein